MTIPYPTMISWFSQLIWPLCRITGLILTMPMISSSLIPVRIRVIFALGLAMIAAPTIPEHLTFLNFNGHYLIYILSEMLLGMVMGFILQLVFQIFILGGQIISMQAGLGFAIMVEPDSSASVPFLSQFYQMMVSLTFLALDGHLTMLGALFSSFAKMPVGQWHAGLSNLQAVLDFSGWIFKEAVLVSLPAILALLIVNLSFGVMTRIAPQLNIFSLGFPISLLMGMLIVQVGLAGVSDQIVDSFEQGMLLIKRIVQ